MAIYLNGSLPIEVNGLESPTGSFITGTSVLPPSVEDLLVLLKKINYY